MPSFRRDRHTVARAWIYVLALVEDSDRIGPVTTLGLDETAFVRISELRHRCVVDPVGRDRQLLAVIEGRDTVLACAWLVCQGERL